MNVSNERSRRETVEIAENTPLDFETWSALSARLLHLGVEEKLSILERQGVALEDWTYSDERHAAALAADVAAGEMARAERYGRACAAEIERRRRGEAAVANAPAPAEGAVPKATPATPLVTGARPASGAEAVPSYMREPMAADAAPRAAPPSLAGTMAAPDLPSFIRRAAGKLPFVDTPSADFVASLEAPRPRPSGVAGETMAIGVDLTAQVPGALPFGRQAGEGATPAARKALVFPRLPLQSYASLCAELAVSPDHAAETLAKYGIKTEEAHRALESEWQGRLAAHADTREEWQKLRDSYEAWLRRGAR